MSGRRQGCFEWRPAACCWAHSLGTAGVRRLLGVLLCMLDRVAAIWNGKNPNRRHSEGRRCCLSVDFISSWRAMRNNLVEKLGLHVTSTSVQAYCTIYIYIYNWLVFRGFEQKKLDEAHRVNLRRFNEVFVDLSGNVLEGTFKRDFIYDLQLWMETFPVMWSFAVVPRCEDWHHLNVCVWTWSWEVISLG